MKIDQVSWAAGELQGVPQFAGLVGVINRSTETQVELDQAAAQEKLIFKQLVLDNLLREHEVLRPQIEGNIGIPNLIDKIDQQFSTFITSTWKPVALSLLEPNIVKLEADLLQLGCPVSQLTAKQVMLEIAKQVSCASQD